MIEGISAVTLGTHEMPRAVRFYRALGFEILHSGKEWSFAGFRAGTSYLNLIPSLPSDAGPGGGAQSSTLPMLTHFTTARSQRDTSRLPHRAMPNGVSASFT
jgi:catechol 2,3-dioxygenase-like lactoylglutathione lyase family enzyme